MKFITKEDAAALVNNGDTIMIGGFLAVGTPETLVDELIKQEKKDLCIIANDTAFVDRGLGKIIVAKFAKKVIASHIGTNPATQEQFIAKELEVELVPQGSLVEKIRAGGVGLGGILTPVGVGTVVEEGKQVIEVSGKKYILELPLHAKVAFIKAKTSDGMGNLQYHLTARNFNPIMALAADIVIAEVDDVVPTGTMMPDAVETPGTLVDYVVVKGGN